MTWKVGMVPKFLRSTLSILVLLGCRSEGPQEVAEWRFYGGDEGGSRYSPLDQINRSNVRQLRMAWIYRTGDIGDGRGPWETRSTFEATPLVVKNVMYLTSPFNRAVALDATTGKLIWEFDPKIDLNRPHNLFVNRGGAFWTGGLASRFIFGTLEGTLYSLDAETGLPDAAFGVNGASDLKEGMYPPGDQVKESDKDFRQAPYSVTSPPAIYRDLVIVGSLAGEGWALGPSGDIRAWDVRTGRLRWRFHTVPPPGEFGHDTWGENSWRFRTGVNAWAPLSVDSQRGIVLVPLGSPGYDYYGSDRPGNNLFGNSLVVLDARTGKRLWHFQAVHHDLWDWDLPAQPTLVTVYRQGRRVDAIAQVTKHGFLFVFHRETGEPLFPIEERAVSQRCVSGERPALTQPFPLKPPAFARQTMRVDELNRLTPQIAKDCEEVLNRVEVFEDDTTGPLFHPAGPEKPTVIFPGSLGGANWSGASFDPTTGLLYVNSNDLGLILNLKRQPPDSDLPWKFVPIDPFRFWTKDRIPCQQPPWGHLTAIDLNTGEFRWRIPLGTVPSLAQEGIRNTGAPNLGGSIVTAGGLVFIAATYDKMFRAFDKLTGELLRETRLPYSGFATPLTYLGQDGKQYVVIAAGGGNKLDPDIGDALVAFALP